ncbi:HK97 gp10 family phage protein [Solibaculum mannosilyticum]|uniref:HK97 gp10 family phage protein n=1 Tax=Solibaculum mannosilyticum TaxID=2780922 RepID=UPI0034C39A92
MRWGRCDFSQLRELRDRIERLSRVDFDVFCRQIANDLAKRLLSMTIRRTPVGKYPAGSGKTGGTLRRGWVVSRIKKTGNYYEITVSNSVLYAMYVEYGHRQEPGRYVPAINARLKASWVPGKFMLTISTKTLERQIPRLIERKLRAYLEDVF